MGAVFFSLDSRLVRFFKTELLLDVFVETGTFAGHTLAEFSGEFDALYSVEFSEKLFGQAQKRFEAQKNIHLFCGNSPDVLLEQKSLWKNQSVFYWLDAHWCEASDTAGAEAQCPLLGELASIGTLSEKSVIVIDDARLFMSAPPGRHNISQWPDLESVWNALKNLSSTHRIVVVNDTFVFYPERLEEKVNCFCQQYGKDVLSAWDKARDYDLLLKQLQEKEACIHEKEACIQEQDACIQNQARQLQKRKFWFRGRV